MFPEENSLELVRAMVGNDVSAEELSDMERDAMAEIGNIILNAVISSMSTTLGLAFDGSLPEVSIIDAEGIFNEAIDRSQAGAELSTVLALTIDFELATRQVNGYLAFLLDIPSGEKLRARIARYIDGV
jgi:chemotaxis protein CheC